MAGKLCLRARVSGNHDIISTPNRKNCVESIMVLIFQISCSKQVYDVIKFHLDDDDDDDDDDGDDDGDDILAKQKRIPTQFSGTTHLPTRKHYLRLRLNHR